MCACDGFGNCGCHENYTLIIDLTNPNITLNYPFDNTTITASNMIVWQYIPYDSINVSYAELYINGVMVLNDSLIESNIPATFSRTLFDGSYNWTIKVVDTAGNYVYSPTRLLEVMVTSNRAGGVGLQRLVEVPLEFASNLLSREKEVQTRNLKIIIFLALCYIAWLLFFKKEREGDRIRKDIFIREQRRD
jgi:hypothetical protein